MKDLSILFQTNITCYLSIINKIFSNKILMEKENININSERMDFIRNFKNMDLNQNHLQF